MAKVIAMSTPSLLKALADDLTNENLGKLCRAAINWQYDKTPFPIANDDDLTYMVAMGYIAKMLELEETRAASKRERAKENPPNDTIFDASLLKKRGGTNG